MLNDPSPLGTGAKSPAGPSGGDRAVWRFRTKEKIGTDLVTDPKIIVYRCRTYSETGEGEKDYYVRLFADKGVGVSIFALRPEGGAGTNYGTGEDQRIVPWLEMAGGAIGDVWECRQEGDSYCYADRYGESNSPDKQTRIALTYHTKVGDLFNAVPMTRTTTSNGGVDVTCSWVQIGLPAPRQLGTVLQSLDGSPFPNQLDFDYPKAH